MESQRPPAPATPSAADQRLLTGGGPTGVVLDELRGRAFVTTRFDNGISVVDTEQFAEIAHLAMFNPEPIAATTGVAEEAAPCRRGRPRPPRGRS